MKQSGLDQILINKVNDPYFVYAGYSAAACVIGPTLHGYELVDDPCIIPKGYSNGIIWEGLALVPYSIFPHYKSDHPESALVEKEVQYRIDHNMPYKTIRDGEVIVI
jgi:dipeptidase E